MVGLVCYLCDDWLVCYLCYDRLVCYLCYDWLVCYLCDETGDERDSVLEFRSHLATERACEVGQSGHKRSSKRKMRDIVSIHPVTVDQSGPVLAKEHNVGGNA